ncbi:hypothetical protein BX616_006284 [Lobosporangium transversale]|uniref:Uncharacterized protein n=1 Tax=Lobosporangium transversale TaxID=64571 RepID=A0A1Y2G9U3_9FUNG|nr:hypothetical protein BCR41DRAFT_400666 [Lobosporangium transversale]KAF9915377.1 hypothetical protein BX616_006284 [Lobosporangium transversale]ORZ05124.1 hypothetical protein BCR41DRAFT_400666 [Lobosporangium transversale]|eukprot:XP_021876899.1 hypothetical protein BCR41DRAFT_400666 [Lobosporangium transversale]
MDHTSEKTSLSSNANQEQPQTVLGSTSPSKDHYDNDSPSSQANQSRAFCQTVESGYSLRPCTMEESCSSEQAPCLAISVFEEMSKKGEQQQQKQCQEEISSPVVVPGCGSVNNPDYGETAEHRRASLLPKQGTIEATMAISISLGQPNIESPSNRCRNQALHSTAAAAAASATDIMNSCSVESKQSITLPFSITATAITTPKSVVTSLITPPHISTKGSTISMRRHLNISIPTIHLGGGLQDIIGAFASSTISNNSPNLREPTSFEGVGGDIVPSKVTDENVELLEVIERIDIDRRNTFRRCEEYEEEMTRVREQAEEKSRKFKEAEKKIKRLRKAERSNARRCEELEKICQEKCSEIQKLESRAKSVAKENPQKYIKLQAEVDKLKQELDIKTRATSETKANVDRLEQEIVRCKDEIEGLRNSCTTMKCELVWVMDKNIKLTEHLEKLWMNTMQGHASETSSNHSSSDELCAQSLLDELSDSDPDFSLGTSIDERVTRDDQKESEGPHPGNENISASSACDIHLPEDRDSIEAIPSNSESESGNHGGQDSLPDGPFITPLYALLETQPTVEGSLTEATSCPSDSPGPQLQRQNDMDLNDLSEPLSQISGPDAATNTDLICFNRSENEYVDDEVGSLDSTLGSMDDMSNTTDENEGQPLPQAEGYSSFVLLDAASGQWALRILSIILQNQQRQDELSIHIYNRQHYLDQEIQHDAWTVQHHIPDRAEGDLGDV